MGSNYMVGNIVRCNDLLEGNTQIPGMVAWFDIECHKQSVSHPQWPQKTRTVPFMVGVFLKNTANDFLFLTATGEDQVIDSLQRLANRGYQLRYSATHSYDEMVVTGRWLYVRRVPLATPGPWKHVVGGNFLNIRSTERRLDWKRGADILSKDIPHAWGDPTKERLITLHNWRDCLMLVASDPEVILSEDSVDLFQASVR